MPKFVGDLVQRDHPDRNIESYSFWSSQSREAAIVGLVASAQETMKSRGIASATLVMKEDDRGIGSRDLENLTP
jgi:hypothetical protein